ncbi:hypothetical protein [Streptomyces sp. NPDC058401]|uniref:hypothetical protein n=1 Tax=Streptomyces sp. NPDC058401 TaxID=3346480 RepID=UPI0036516F3F
MLRTRLAQAAAVTALTSSFLVAGALQASTAQAAQPSVSAAAPAVAPAGTAPAAGKDTMGWS